MSHLAHFEDVAVQSATNPDVFNAEKTRIETAGGIDPDRIAEGYQALSSVALLQWFDSSRAQLIEVFGELDPPTRLALVRAADEHTDRVRST